MGRFASSNIRTLRLRHPLGGVQRGRAYQDQEPFTTPRAVNVFPSDSFTGRDRIGQRPGKARLYPQQLGAGKAIRLLSSVSRVLSNPPQRWTDNFDQLPSSSVWDTKIGGGGAVLQYLASENGIQAMTALRTPLDIDTAKPYSIEVDFNRPITGGGILNTLDLRVYFRYLNSAPASGDGGFVRLYISNEASTCVVEIYENGGGAPVATSGGFVVTPAANGTLRVDVNAGNVAKKVVANVFGADRANVVLTNANDNTKQRLGLDISAGGQSPPVNRAVATEFRVTYTSLTPAANANAVVPIAGVDGKLYADNPSGTVLAGQLVQVTQASVLTLSPTRRLMAADLLQKSYIADWDASRYISSTPCNVSTTGAVTAGPDWTTRGISLLDDVAIVLTPTGGTTAGVYKITSFNTTTLQLAGYTTTPSAGTATIRIERALKIYDPKHETQQLEIWMTTPGKGLVPHGCTIVTQFANSILLGGDPQAPHVWYMSRRDNPKDFDYVASSTDRGRAIAGTVTNQSNVGDPITALVPFFADYCVFATYSKLLLMRGDPRIDGTLDTITDRVGIIDRFAHCKNSEGDVFFLAHDGLRVLQASSSPRPELLSKDRIPLELVGIDTNAVEISMEYDVQENGILIGLTPTDGSAASHWWFDVKRAAFWEASFPLLAQPRVQHIFNSENPALRCVVQGDGDGYLRTFRRAQYFDDVPSLAMADKRIVSRVQYGPFGPSGRQNTIAAMLHTIEAQLAAGSGPIAWSAFAATDAEGAIRATTPFKSGVFASTAVSKRTIRQLVAARGGAFIIELAGSDATGASAWAIEGVDANLSSQGPQLQP